MAVFHQGRHGGRAHQDVGQAVLLVKFKFKRFTSCQGYGAKFGHHQATIANFRGQQGHITSQTRTDLTVVDNLACGTVSVELHDARHEVSITDAVSCGGE